MVEFSPAMRETRVRLPANASLHYCMCSRLPRWSLVVPANFSANANVLNDDPFLNFPGSIKFILSYFILCFWLGFRVRFFWHVHVLFSFGNVSFPAVSSQT